MKVLISKDAWNREGITVFGRLGSNVYGDPYISTVKTAGGATPIDSIDLKFWQEIIDLAWYKAVINAEGRVLSVEPRSVKRLINLKDYKAGKLTFGKIHRPAYQKVFKIVNVEEAEVIPEFNRFANSAQLLLSYPELIETSADWELVTFEGDKVSLEDCRMLIAKGYAWDSEPKTLVNLEDEFETLKHNWPVKISFIENGLAYGHVNTGKAWKSMRWDMSGRPAFGVHKVNGTVEKTWTIRKKEPAPAMIDLHIPVYVGPNGTYHTDHNLPRQFEITIKGRVLATQTNNITLHIDADQ